MAHENLDIRIDRPQDEELPRPRKPYVRPRVEVVRALQAVVLGGSPAAGDSGAGTFTEKPPGM
jgi:hypothetical protein